MVAHDSRGRLVDVLDMRMEERGPAEQLFFADLLDPAGDEAGSTHDF
ncbi:MAG: hypothetical protein WGN25_05105 [Candidatus Electrothrix sp. GW3-4]